ncbi:MULTISPECIES: PDR/VanB family oxidoreductase [Microvirga]|uniref:PDR/VanB family oxidoreductase n=2 Tax=Microvirga TaxID=186650 RepID=UPI001B37CEC1|nr:MULTISPECIES: PDR/VanB family oxidoreductase [unclassified Microvirga]MBQ0819395.1 oxidoreductase [Microvirga sp. HBU67558]
MASPRLIMKMKVASLRSELGDVSVIEFRHPKRPELPPFEAGAHVDVHLPTGKIRQYSLMGDPADLSRYIVGVKLEAKGRGGSAWLHDNLRVGDEVPVSAPRNHFRLSPDGAKHLLIAGGIGVTPMIAMAHALKAQGKAFTLHYFSRSRSLAPMARELEAELPAGSVVFHFDDEPSTSVDMTELLKVVEEGTHLYYCGPPGFMAWIRAESAHWPTQNVHFEAFQPETDRDFVPEAFSVRLRSSGREFEVPADASALSILRTAGVLLFSSCENGVCGSCECGILSGEPIHRDAVLSPEARTKRFIPCVSRAKGQIVLDL